MRNQTTDYNQLNADRTTLVTPALFYEMWGCRFIHHYMNAFPADISDERFVWCDPVQCQYCASYFVLQKMRRKEKMWRENWLSHEQLQWTRAQFPWVSILSQSKWLHPSERSTKQSPYLLIFDSLGSDGPVEYDQALLTTSLKISHLSNLLWW